MRLDFNILKNIEEWYGNDNFAVGSSFEKDSITIRFGYWSEVNTEELNSLLPFSIEAVINEVDEDDDTGVLYNYIIKRKHVL